MELRTYLSIPGVVVASLALILYVLTYAFQNTGRKLEFPVVMYLRHFMHSPPFLYMIGLNVLPYRTFSPIHYRKGGESMICLKYITTGNSSFHPVEVVIALLVLTTGGS